MTSSLIADGPSTPQQQQKPKPQSQHKVYYKRQPSPKSKGPVVASAPSYIQQMPPGTVPMCEWRYAIGVVGRALWPACWGFQAGTPAEALRHSGKQMRVCTLGCSA
jgi:hypothetical protein